MKTYKYPSKNDWPSLVLRPVLDSMLLQEKVKLILDDVKANGDAAIKKYSEQFDGVVMDDFLVTKKAISEAVAIVPADLKKAIEQAANNIRVFHKKQVQSVEIIETMPGVQCWRKSIAIEKVGLYIPGGNAPLFSTILMLGIPATVAGCGEIILCSPPNKKGQLHPAILFTAQLLGITKIYKIGGVQAIAAMAYGTTTVPKVFKIFGPGNQYVDCAKQLVQLDGIAIDMPAGPSEVCVLADETAEASFVAADLLSQAEHGVDSQVLLISTSEAMVNNVKKEIEKQLIQLPAKDIAAKALENSKAIIVKDMNEAISLVNEYAAEHLIISCTDNEAIAERIINAGSIFLGNYSPESAGDYASGTNHTLPTNGNARAYSGVSMDSFVKKITYQKLSKQGLENIGRTVELMAEAEGLVGHKNAVSIRLKNS